MNDITTIVKMVANIVEGEIEEKEDPIKLTMIEQITREVMQEIGRQTVMSVVQNRESKYAEDRRRCHCGEEAKYVRRRETQLQTLLGKCRVKRAYYVCPNCHQGHYPLDNQLGLRPNAFSAELERLVGMTGIQVPFGKGSELFAELTKVPVSEPRMAKACQQIGEKVKAQEQEWAAKANDEGWLQKQKKTARRPLRYYGAIDATKVHVREADGHHWRDLKVGAWFEAGGEAPKTPKGDWQIRAKNIQYYADIAPCGEFGNLFWQTGVRHKANLATELIILGDGAEWIWNLVAEHFPQAIQILDWFHAVEHLQPVAQALFSDSDLQEVWRQQAKQWLWDGEIDILLDDIRQHQSYCHHDVLRTTLNYYDSHRERMRYAHFRKQGFQIGSGTIESAAKQIGIMRMKVPGASWHFDNARLVAKARASFLSDQWHSLPLAS